MLILPVREYFLSRQKWLFLNQLVINSCYAQYKLDEIYYNRRFESRKREIKKKNTKKIKTSWRKGSRHDKDFSMESKRIRKIRDSKISWNSPFFVFS